MINWWSANCAALGCPSFSCRAGLSGADCADRCASRWPETASRHIVSTVWLCLLTILLVTAGSLAGWQIWRGGNPIYPEIQIFGPTDKLVAR